MSQADNRLDYGFKGYVQGNAGDYKLGEGYMALRRRHQRDSLTLKNNLDSTGLPEPVPDGPALQHGNIRHGASVVYARAPRLFSELANSKADGSHGRRLLALARVDLLILDDWGLAMLTSEQSRDFLEILDDRYDRRSTMIVSQIPVDLWHAQMPDPTIADAALDRLVHNAYRIILTGESMRKNRAIQEIAQTEQNVTDAARDASRG